MKKVIQSLSEPPPIRDTLTTGAPSALTFISTHEAKARAEFEAAQEELVKRLKLQIERPVTEDERDYDRDARVASAQRDDAFERWDEWAKKLNMFHKSVDPATRDASEKLSRNEVESVLTMVQIYFRAGMEGLIVTFCDSVLSCKTQAEVYQLLSDKIRDCMRNAFDSAKREEQLPEWCEKAMEVK